MKRSKKLYILLGVLAVLCAVTIGVINYEEKQENIKNTNEIILAVDIDSVSALSWEYDDVSLAFHKDEAWLYDEDEAFPADEDVIESLLSEFESFGASFIIEDVEDYSQYGLDEPVCTITLAADGEAYEILLGDFSVMDSQRYVSIGDGNVYLVTSDPMDAFELTLSDMIANDVIPSFENVTGIMFSGTENYTITYEEDSTSTYCADDVYFTQQNGSTVPLDTSKVESYLKSIYRLGLTDYVTYNVSDEELEGFGLTEPDLTVTVDFSAADDSGEETAYTFVLHISAVTEENSDGEDELVSAYARVGDSQIVYEITASEYEALIAAAYDDLRHSQLFTGSFDDITQLDITLDGSVYTIALSEDDDGEPIYLYGEEEISISSLQSAVESLSIDSFSDESPEDKSEISLIIYLDNEYFPQVSIELYRYDGTSCIALIDDKPIGFVSRSAAVTLIEAVNAIILG